jgi:hypothetical protein
MGAEEIIDRLYALPLEKFTRARNEAERELRKDGEREQADQVKALRKPTAAAAAANRLVHAHRARVEAFLRAAATLRDAQFAGKGNLAAAAQTEREELEQLVSLGGEAVRPTLEAAAVDDNTARELLQARLVREPEPAGFGTLLAHAEPAVAKGQTDKQVTARPTPAATKLDDSAAKAQLREAKRMLGAATAEERQAKQHWAQTQRELERARAAVERAQQELDRLRSS